MAVKFFRLNFILFLVCFFSFEIAGFADPHDGLVPDQDIENEFEMVRPVCYKLVKVPVPEKLSLDDISEPLPEKELVDFVPFSVPASHSTHNFFISGAKLARELSTIAS